MTDRPIPLSRVLIEEYRSQGLAPELTEAEVSSWRPAADPQGGSLEETTPEAADAPIVGRFYAWLHREKVQRSALCLSGGGIRSATFGLGLIQSLAKFGLLSKLDYLSTVSGGGYVGGWLSAWIRQAAQVEKVEAELAAGASGPLDPEPRPVQYLRRYSRYMSPEVGLLSADTWTLIATFLRNLIVNWLVLLPLIAAILIVPRLGFWLVRLRSEAWVVAHLNPLVTGLYWFAVAAGALAIAYIGANRPSLRGKSRFPAKWQDQKGFLLLCLLPLALMAVASTLGWAWLRLDPQDVTVRLPAIPGLSLAVRPVLTFILFGVLLHVVGFLLSRLWVREMAPGEALAVVASGGVGGWLAWLVASTLLPSPQLESDSKAGLYVLLAVPALLFLFFLASVAFSAMASHYTGDEDREWLARAAGWILIAIFARVLFVGLVIFGPVLLLEAKLWLSTSIGGLSGVATYILSRRGGGSKKTANGEKKKPGGGIEAVALSLAAPVFVASLLAALSLATTLLLKWVTELRDPGFPWQTSPDWLNHEPIELLNIVEQTPSWAILAVLAAFLVASAVAGSFVDANRFSLHGAYRDRLVRAYLGASRGDRRRPSSFTGFDPDDNVELTELGKRPFHVLNAALNLVGGKDLAWQDRKAETFTLSPLHCGNYRLGYRGSERYGRHRRGSRAISLGTAMATSGAAASPNQGYHSSPVVTFLLAFFNVRLGRWQGNPGPAGKTTWTSPGPRYAGRPLFDEAFGLTDDTNPYVYLSDGGHFENLGLYEMVLRRVHFIILSDGGHDPSFSFGDLGNAVAKIRIDLGVPIDFDQIPMRPRSAEGKAYDTTTGGKAAPYCALGRIRYRAVDGPTAEDGLILYFKPALNGTEPLDVFRYSRTSATFPHEPTADQLYSEAQFESYRALGFHAMTSVLSALPAGAGLAELFEKPAGG